MRERTIYSFPEPEKTSSWESKEAPIALVDNEYEAAVRRTELIKKYMSPEGELGLAPKLEAARWKYGITDSFFRVRALFDRIFVFPIDAEDGEDAQKTKGGIWKPNTTRLRDLQEGNRGVILSAGLTAMDRLMSHGVELGDIIVTNKNVPFARRCEEIEGKPLHYLVMREADLAGDETLEGDIRAGRARVVDVGGSDRYEHQLERLNENGEWTTLKKQSVYINDTW